MISGGKVSVTTSIRKGYLFIKVFGYTSENIAFDITKAL
ncbi:hypothetical protein LEP1GSC050_3744 [Leptospira broomii serovar Hurstbridge str. 5399]|uniref:Uncharacterized protein n=1 Tax=Leptospira broomii serovar Hurstbridge str. 5399 TaxID=1049789 RepID=T0FA76_9LEPT|nr:hypothetical protein LEP1GSC050_3744 [Leptospira broomii serovar Hurstbridge str. 5399]